MTRTAHGDRPLEAAERPASGMAYLPGLDGLRAFSLVAILLFHAGFGWARGGYLGVSVFFTLSGFLVTSLLLAEHQVDGALRIGGFYLRRAKRLMPAVVALVVLVLVLVGLGALSPSQGWRGDAIASSLWSANWRFVLTGDSYGAVFGSPSPFQHMWSLAVEEQFYLLLPVTLLLFLRRRSSRLRLIGAVTAGIAVSTWLCATLYVGTATGRAYFGTDTRMAEPLVGVLLALVLFSPSGLRVLPERGRRALDVASVAAAIGLTALLCRFGEYDPRLYHGGFLLVALLAAVLIAAVTQPDSWASRLLSARPLVAVGVTSYGAYLYHWPLFLWMTPKRLGVDAGMCFAFRCAATLLLANLSYRFLEQPIRRGKLRLRIAVPVWAVSTVGIVSAATLISPLGASAGLVNAAADSDANVPPPPITVVTGQHPTATKVHGHASAAVGRARSGAHYALGPVRSGSGGSQPASRSGGRAAASTTPSSPASSAGQSASTGGPVLRVAVVGDSMGDGLGKALIQWAQQRSGVSVYNLSGSGCPLAYGGTQRWPDGEERDVSKCGWWADPNNNRSIDMVKFDPDIIVVQDGANEMLDRKLPSWATYESPGDGVYDNWMLSMYQNAFQTFRNNSAPGAQILHLNAVCGDWSQNPHWGNAGNPAGRVSQINLDYSTINQSNYSLRDFNSVLCPNNQFTNTIYGVSDARPDGYHLSSQAALAVVNHWLGPLIMQTGAAAPAQPAPRSAAKERAITA